MKNFKHLRSIFLLVVVSLSNFSFAQVALGKAGITPNPSISLEFGAYVAGQGRGIIVPWVTSAVSVTGVVPGTIVYDTADKIMKYNTGATTWVNLSRNETTTVEGTANYDTTGVVNTSLQDTNNGAALSDLPSAKVSIGTVATPSVPGILVLEDNNKAMVLPLVPSPHLNIKNPEPGTMVFDTVKKQLCIFNGKVWSFWKP